MRVVIIGGGTAGTTCAFEMRKLNKDIEIIILEQNDNYQYSPCALPYVLSGEINDFEKIILLEENDYKKNNIEIRLFSEVKKVENKTVFFDNDNLTYDKLVIATGAQCQVPEGLKNIDVNYLQLHNLNDARKIAEGIDKAFTSVIIGAGMVGIELAMALLKQNHQVVLLEKEKMILSSLLDVDMAEILQAKLSELSIILNANIKEVTETKIVLENKTIDYDNLYVCTGMTPNICLAQTIGLDFKRGIVVNEYLETSLPDVYACGDCIEVTEHYTNEKVVKQLGSLAVEQAQIVARNVLGERIVYQPVVGCTISKIGDVVVGSVGLTEKRAAELNLKVISARYSDSLRAKYYNDADKVIVKLIVDYEGVVVGAQLIGQTEIAGQLNLLSLAIKENMPVKKLANMETCYNPAVVPIFDPMVMCAKIIEKKVSFLKNNI